MKSSARAVVVHPAFAIERRDLNDFLQEFGPYEGRYVPSYPSNWTAECVKHIEEHDLKPVERKRWLETVLQLDHCTTFPVDRPWDKAADWEANASGYLKARPDALIIGNALDPEPFSAWPQSVEEVRESRCRSWPYRGAVGEYLEVCRPLLVKAPAAYFIDRFLDPLASPVENLLRSVFAAIKGSKCYQVHLITRHQACGGKGGDPKTWLPKIEIESELNRLYASHVGKDRELLVHLVEEPRWGVEDLRLHDRFFLTKFGVIKFGKGFVLDDLKHPQNTAVVLDRNRHEGLKREYIDGVTRFGELIPRAAGIPRPSKVTTIAVRGSDTTFNQNF